jgi:single-strand DNA-binding protein
MYQSLTIIGRLGKDPEMRYMPSGDPVTSFSVATDRSYNDKNSQRVKETTWFRVSVFGKQAENANTYLHKGSMVLVEGRLATDPKTNGPRIWTGQDGTVHASFEMVANQLRFLSPKSEGGGAAGAEAGEPAAGGAEHGGEGEDIPF